MGSDYYLNPRELFLIAHHCFICSFFAVNEYRLQVDKNHCRWLYLTNGIRSSDKRLQPKIRLHNWAKAWTFQL
jgi:hypothetical protein